MVCKEGRSSKSSDFNLLIRIISLFRTGRLDKFTVCILFTIQSTSSKAGKLCKFKMSILFSWHVKNWSEGRSYKSREVSILSLQTKYLRLWKLCSVKLLISLNAQSKNIKFSKYSMPSRLLIFMTEEALLTLRESTAFASLIEISPSLSVSIPLSIRVSLKTESENCIFWVTPRKGMKRKMEIANTFI